MKIISLLTILAVILAPAPVLAQSTLEPCEMEFLGAYYRGVDKIIDDAVGGAPRLSLTTLPSFFPESGVRLVGDEVYFVQFGASYWHEASASDRRSRRHKGSSPVQISVYHAPISHSISERIEQSYTSAIKGASKSDRLGLDGVSYRFTKPGIGCGGAWSPDPGTSNAQLVELSELLARHAKLSKPPEIRRSEATMTTLLNLIGR